MFQNLSKRRGGRAALWLVVGLLAGGTAGALGTYLVKRGKAGIPGGPRLGAADEMVLVPGEAAGFVHVRLRDIWNTEAFTEFRKIVDKAGPEARAALDEGFVPTPSSIDRLTMVYFRAPTERQPKPAPAPKNPPPGWRAPPKPSPVMDTVILLRFTEPYSADKVRDANLKGAEPKKHGDKEYWVTPTPTVDPKMPKGATPPQPRAVHFANDKTLAVGHPDAMTKFLSRPPSGTNGPLTRPLAFAAEGGWHLVAAFNPAAFEYSVTESFRDDLPPNFAPAVEKANAIANKVQSVVIAAAFAEETKVQFRAVFKDAAAATDGEEAVRAFVKMTREQLDETKKEMHEKLKGGQKGPRPLSDLPRVVGTVFGLGAMTTIDEFLADLPLKREDSELILSPKLPSMGASNAVAFVAFAGMWTFTSSAPINMEPPDAAPFPKGGKNPGGPPVPPPPPPLPKKKDPLPDPVP
jgi:hypothetical protein